MTFIINGILMNIAMFCVIIIAGMLVAMFLNEESKKVLDSIEPKPLEFSDLKYIFVPWLGFSTTFLFIYEFIVKHEGTFAERIKKSHERSVRIRDIPYN